MLNVVMLSVIMLIVVAPLQHNQIFAEEARDSPSVPHFEKSHALTVNIRLGFRQACQEKNALANLSTFVFKTVILGL